jgi:hypothetical protein
MYLFWANVLAIQIVLLVSGRILLIAWIVIQMEYFFSKRINAFNYAKLGITKISALVYAACVHQVNILLEIKQIVVVMRIA